MDTTMTEGTSEFSLEARGVIGLLHDQILDLQEIVHLQDAHRLVLSVFVRDIAHRVQMQSRLLQKKYLVPLIRYSIAIDGATSW